MQSLVKCRNFNITLAKNILYRNQLYGRYRGRYGKYGNNRAVLRRKENNTLHESLLQQLEMEKVISYFTASLGAVFSVEDILWDISHNCISQLGFEDCVIYLIDYDKQCLIQKAAWGPKTTEAKKILNPIEIPLGKGIVGAVAISGNAEIIADTSKDHRYIIDDERRFSEITIPIKTADRIIGVLDSEHHQKNFYTARHRQILETVAAICANKIVLAQTELQRHQAALDLLIHQRKSAEAKLQSMRLQMNPHFLFNSLNSIQQLILRNHTDDAARYLSRFSKLLRQVLTYSDYNTVSLAKEIEMLELYLQLEALRFKESFEYHISTSSMIDQDEMEIPTLLVQPFVENAIWHGLLHKTGDRKLSIRFHLSNEEQIICMIEDNGIGREAAQKISQSLKDDLHTGKGIRSADERLRLFNEQFDAKSILQIEDLKDVSGAAIGTRVTIFFPLWNE